MPKKKILKLQNSTANDSCRSCPFEFAVKYEKFGKPSWENLYKISTNQEYNDSTMLSRLCEDLGFSFPKSSEHFEIICKPCGRSLRRTYAFYQQLKSAFLKEADQTTKDSGGDEEYLEARCKRRAAVATLIALNSIFAILSTYKERRFYNNRLQILHIKILIQLFCDD